MKHSISVNGISKEYVLGSEFIAGQSFRELISGAIKAPFRKFRRLSGKDQDQERFWALKDISFDVAPGEIIGIIGRNGAGKSTLLKVLSRITAPTVGSVKYQGRLASLLEVGTGFHPELSGRENIFLNGAILGMSRAQIKQRLDEIVEFAEVAKFLDTPVKRYSSGMYVRLAFSVAAHLDPDILIIDEVLAVGDQAFQQKCLGKIQGTANDGRTVLFVSHNMTVIKSLCTRIIYINEGQVEFDGEPELAIRKYLSSEKSQEAEWSDLKGENIHLKSASIGTPNHKVNNIVQCDEEALVSMQLENMDALGTVALCRVTDVFGNIIFTSWDTDELEHRVLINEKKLVCHVPANLLRPGNYVVSVMVRYLSNNAYKTEEVNIDLIVSSERSNINDARLGLVAPKVQWRRID